MTFEDYLFESYTFPGNRKGQRRNWNRNKYNWYVIELSNINVTYKYDHIYYKAREMRIIEFDDFGVTLTVKGSKTEEYLKELGFEQISEEVLKKEYSVR